MRNKKYFCRLNSLPFFEKVHPHRTRKQTDIRLNLKLGTVEIRFTSFEQKTITRILMICRSTYAWAQMDIYAE